MKEIAINSKKYGQHIVLVDDDMFDWLNQWKWHVGKFNNIFYAARTSLENKNIFMHREVLGITNQKLLCDHRDHNGLNNQKSNLRIASYSQNNSNRGSYKTSSSKYKGVHWDKRTFKWRASIHKDKVSKKLGWFINEIDAAKKYNEWAVKLHGEFANLNEIA